MRTHFKHFLNVLFVIAFFCLVFHATLNICNTKLKTYGVYWGLLDIQNALHVCFKVKYFAYKKHSRFGGEINKL